ncbi:hypothetical protein [Litorihabitans aurantiacus]|uniref:DUF3137 domain-containing protein n=1 Tax=Litorihabitans aurantiacus TaxID=1930061 RepID=A0AA38CV40_9MICO|nr:hypothetical protein [Litorihabitans aurantiacus]GMA33234.1 hypothetical protein GCM10025875_32260 [Litorihabitans aurantiacus]
MSGPREDGRATAPTGHLDAPLARTLRFDALRRRPAREEVARVRGEAAAGAYGDAGREAVGSGRDEPRRMTYWVSGAFAGLVLLIGLIGAVVEREPVFVLFALGSAAAMGLLGGGVAFAVTAAVVASRWRRHTQAAAFADDNGLALSLVVPPEALAAALPAAVRAEEGTHADVLAGVVRGRTLLMGARRREVRTGSDRTSTYHLVWVALRVDGGGGLVDGVADGVAGGSRAAALRMPALAALDRRVRDAVPKGQVVVARDEWLTLGVEGSSGSLAVLEDLLGVLDGVLKS